MVGVRPCVVLRSILAPDYEIEGCEPGLIRLPGTGFRSITDDTRLAQPLEDGMHGGKCLAEAKQIPPKAAQSMAD